MIVQDYVGLHLKNTLYKQYTVILIPITISCSIGTTIDFISSSMISIIAIITMKLSINNNKKMMPMALMRMTEEAEDEYD